MIYELYLNKTLKITHHTERKKDNSYELCVEKDFLMITLAEESQGDFKNWFNLFKLKTYVCQKNKNKIKLRDERWLDKPFLHLYHM